MKKLLFATILVLGLEMAGIAQEKVWSLENCMQYAVDNSFKVKIKEHSFDTDKADYTSSIASFFPALEISGAAQYNYGRSIDPETNTYKNTTTFNNYYQASGSIPLFYGGQLVNEWRKAKVNRQMGMNSIQKAKDDLALEVMIEYVNVVYNGGMVAFCEEKLEESIQVLRKTQRQEELGLKSKADVILIDAQVATDDYQLTHQQNQLNMSMSALKQLMNYPISEELFVDMAITETAYLPMLESVDEIYLYAKESNPTALQADYELKAAKMTHLIQKGKLFPSIYFYAGINTSYYDNLKSEVKPVSFKSQFKNNRGEYFGVNFSIPLFSRLNKITEVRRARNNMRIAQEQQNEVLRQLQTTIEKAVLDKGGYAKETIQMRKKTQADAFAYQVTSRKYEEGLMSPLDLQNSANILIQSKANLLQKKLMYYIKTKEVDYYKGEPLIIEE